ncbi:twin transmembrane helix small protein [Hydrogenophaga defluvii]|uniref:Twin transmembrane helix small protein n=1 Tax=Hydrogenophaga defluvii TaxID=249410 RepID=A0ABW2SG47_9BURK
MKWIAIVGFVAIIGSLAAALFFMMRRPSEGDHQARSRHMARALTFRIGFSVLLFVLVLVAYLMGWIQPTGLPVSR